MRMDQITSQELASLSARLSAGAIDLLLILVSVWAITRIVYHDVPPGVGPGPEAFVIVPFTIFASYLIINGFFLASKGQTIGKKLLRIQIVNVQNDSPPSIPIILGRTLLYLISLLTPCLILWFVDVLSVFRSDRRCLHDLAAGTKVVRLR